MPRAIRVLSLLVAGLLASAGVEAQQPAAPAPAPPAPAPAPSPVKLSLDLGFMNASGNTDVTTLNFGDNLTVKAKHWEIRELGNVVYGRTDGATTAEQYKVDLRLDRQLVAVLHFFVGGTFERNEKAGISRRFEEYAGFGIRLIDLPKDLWTLDLGSSVNQQRSTSLRRLNFAAMRTAMAIRHNFTQAAYFQESAEYLPDLQNKPDWRVNSETAVIAPLAGRVAIRLSYVVKFDNLPEVGFEKSDRIVTTAVQIAF